MKERNKGTHDSNNDDDDEEEEEDDEETTTTTTTTNNNRITKRRKNAESPDSNDGDTTSTLAIDQLRQRKRSSSSTSSYLFNSNNKRVINNEEGDENEKNERVVYKEKELKSKLKKDLLLICQSLDVTATMNQTKDTIIQSILKIQNDRLSFKHNMIDNNPLQDYNKGSLEYSLPWPIISRILDLLWTQSSICTCYYSDQFISTVKSHSTNNDLGIFHYYQMWPLYKPLLDQYKESRMKCPMHSYYYSNGLVPSIIISAPFVFDLKDKPIWRVQLLTLSKRVNQYFSFKYFTNVKLSFNQDLWNHINGQYCPIKTPKQLSISNAYDYDSFGNNNTSIFSTVEKLSIVDQTNFSTSHIKSIQKQFKNIKSFTLRNYCAFKTPFLSQFKNLTSLNLIFAPYIDDQQQLLNILKPGMIKLLLPSEWTTEEITLKPKLANTIQISNITPPNQMPNLHTFHLPYASYDMSSFDHPNVTKLVDPCTNSQAMSLIVPPTIDTLKFSADPSLFLDINLITKATFFNELNVNKLIINCQTEISDQTINQMKRHGYEYDGAIRKLSTKRQLHFIKTTTPSTPEIIIQTPDIVVHKQVEINNPTLPFYLIEKIIGYSWNSYYCTCDIETTPDNENRTHSRDITDYIKQSEIFLKAKSICPMHKNHIPNTDTYHRDSPIQQINQQRFGISQSCKRLFEYVSNHLVKRSSFAFQEYETLLRHQHYSNQYCLMGKSIENLIIEVPHQVTGKVWEFLNLHHYSNTQSLKFMLVRPSQLPSVPVFINSLGRLQSLTSLDISQWRLLDQESTLAIKELKNLPLRKLYYQMKDNQFLFQDNNDGDSEDDSSKWPITKSLESVSINSFDVIPKLDRLPKLRHLRIDIEREQGQNGNVELTEQQIQSILPSTITKLSFSDTNIAKISQYNPQVNQLVMLSPNNNYYFDHQFYLPYDNVQKISIRMVSIHHINRRYPHISPQSNFQLIGTFYTSINTDGTVNHKWVYLRKNQQPYSSTNPTATTTKYK
ncbi:hypothetical protein DFA_00094 [Cavenderia fasciculata]|uniref:Uncharacterized protein n=1 Tax=Cavenderia fasciculata TaxID=261658 RepID=F4PXK6_CACFS|nr:uncharacterized protein DFA_00094 [Cavenderia fasciculata]EGG19516.1 hypothetical protein DFA_00094 [Cavenderia fasciculata]|eukprot:XP_004357810.1 hypothetical protein DFA_00094 [Cavenderia fasciculata]